MKSYISSIGTANPVNKTPQKDIAGFMAGALKMNNGEEARLKALYRASGIQHRYSVLEDYGNRAEDFTFYPNNHDLEPFPSVSARMSIYKKEAVKLSQRAIMRCLADSSVSRDKITHLITVSCTGMYAPGIDIEIVETLGLNRHIQRTAINFMGCYAAFNAIKVADAFCRTSRDVRVLVVCVELCSIHFQKQKDADNLLSNALFGDGAAAVIIQPDRPEGLGLGLEEFYCDLVFEGKNDMAWQIGNSGFEMRLSSYVPDMIKSGIRTLTENLLINMGLTIHDIDLFAIHPGGKRILEIIEQELKLSKEDNTAAYTVLRNYGNMSSATILFVLHEIWKGLQKGDEGKNLLSFAFGPGLTMESMLLKVTGKCKPQSENKTNQ